METKLASYPGVVVARYNPWRFGHDDELLLAFFETLAIALDRSLSSGVERR